MFSTYLASPEPDVGPPMRPSYIRHSVCASYAFFESCLAASACASIFEMDGSLVVCLYGTVRLMLSWIKLALTSPFSCRVIVDCRV